MTSCKTSFMRHNTLHTAKQSRENRASALLGCVAPLLGCETPAAGEEVNKEDAAVWPHYCRRTWGLHQRAVFIRTHKGTPAFTRRMSCARLGGALNPPPQLAL